MKQEKIHQLYKECTSKFTELTQEIHHFILGTGNPDANVLFLGDLPTKEEEEQGSPFTGEAGKILEKSLEALGLERKDIYTSHVLKYRPYKISEATGRITNRPPEKEEIDFFIPYLQKEIGIINPKIIITLGQLALQAIMEDDSLDINKEQGKIRSKQLNNKSYKILPLDHNPIDKETSLILKKLIDYTKEEKEKIEYKIPPKKTSPTKPATIKQSASKAGKKNQVILIYGGDGYAEDPTLVAMDRISQVLVELDTRITKIDLYKEDYQIHDFFKELKDAKGVIIGATIEWLGLSGHLQHFLDKCWKYGNKSLFENIFLFSVVISKQQYERDAYNHLIKAWELLGGIEGTSVIGSIKKSIDLETNPNLLNVIDKKTEEFYRIINQNRQVLPTSIRKNKILIEVPYQSQEIPDQQIPHHIKTTSTLPDYQEYIEKQQEDIKEISQLIKKKVTIKESIKEMEPSEIFQRAFIPNEEEIDKIVQWNINDKSSESFVMDIKTETINVYKGTREKYNTIINLDFEILQKIIEKKITIQRAFMTGEIKVKGEFDVLYKLDTIFELKK